MKCISFVFCMAVAACTSNPKEISGEKWQGFVISNSGCVAAGEPWFTEEPHAIKVGVSATQIMLSLARDPHGQVVAGDVEANGKFSFYVRIQAPDTNLSKRLTTIGFGRPLQVEGQINNEEIVGSMYLHHPGTSSGCGGKFKLQRL